MRGLADFHLDVRGGDIIVDLPGTSYTVTSQSSSSLLSFSLPCPFPHIAGPLSAAGPHRHCDVIRRGIFFGFRQVQVLIQPEVLPSTRIRVFHNQVANISLALKGDAHPFDGFAGTFTFKIEPFGSGESRIRSANDAANCAAPSYRYSAHVASDTAKEGMSWLAPSTAPATVPE